MSTTMIHPFEVADAKSLREFRALLASFERRMETTNPGFISSPDAARRVFYATDGVLRNVANLLGKADRIMRDGNARTLSFPILLDAFKHELFFDCPPSTNPFSPTFEYRRLTLKGEPYEFSELDGDNHDRYDIADRTP